MQIHVDQPVSRSGRRTPLVVTVVPIARATWDVDPYTLG